MHEIRINRWQRNWAPDTTISSDIEQVREVGEGEEVVLETQDALDGQITPVTTTADLAISIRERDVPNYVVSALLPEAIVDGG